VTKPLPGTSQSLVLRTDFSDDSSWRIVREAIEAPSAEDGFRACVEFVEDRAFEGAAVGDLLQASSASGHYRSFMCVVDRQTIADPEHPVLVIDLAGQPGRVFRVIPAEMWGVENNLSIGNMDFDEFAWAVDDSGVFRGFK
jgi:hypothetical protein